MVMRPSTAFLAVPLALQRKLLLARFHFFSLFFPFASPDAGCMHSIVHTMLRERRGGGGCGGGDVVSDTVEERKHG